jgi:hypothetical protein
MYDIITAVSWRMGPVKHQGNLIGLRTELRTLEYEALVLTI